MEKRKRWNHYCYVESFLAEAVGVESDNVLSLSIRDNLYEEYYTKNFNLSDSGENETVERILSLVRNIDDNRNSIYEIRNLMGVVTPRRVLL